MQPVMTPSTHPGHPPFPGSKAESPLPVGLWNGFQALLRIAQNRGKIHYDQRQRARHQACAKGIGEHEHSHKTVDDGGNAAERFRSVFDDTNQLSVGCVLRQVHRRANAKGNYNHQRSDDDVNRVQNVGQNTDSLG